MVAVMSGCWVQGGRCAAADKWTRSRLALTGGVDLVLELPTVWAVSSAETFAQGAVGVLAASGVVDVLSFGSECGAADRLRQVAECLNSPAYEAGVRRFVDEGMPFAAARQEVVRGILGPECSALLVHAKQQSGRGVSPGPGQAGQPHPPRDGPPGGSSPRQSAGGSRAPGISLRHPAPRLSGGGGLAGGGALPPRQRSGAPAGGLARDARPLAGGAGTAGPAEDHDRRGLGRPPGQRSGGGPSPPPGAGRKAVRSLEEFFQLAKPRHWTQARMRRLLVWAFLGLTRADRPDAPPYLRVLGFNARGQELLKP